ncbi:S8 family serine peptidase [Microbulbifer sp. CnH-101-G]|uniref:S8 family serine peptidase n=1 Tax=Microbulbifer sp. CnH-101-G TaxID=3243393 RepID=UPI00403A59E0
MNKKMFRLSAISAAVLLALTGCDSNSNSSSDPVAATPVASAPTPTPTPAPTPADQPPTASNVTISGVKQGISVSGELLGNDPDGDSLTYSFSEKDKTISSVDGVYTFSHGELSVNGNQFEYTSISGQDASITYTVTANGASASAKIEIIADIPPTANTVTIDGAKQWIPISVELLGNDEDGDELVYSFSENGVAVNEVDGIYTFSHGELKEEDGQFEYRSISGQDATITYTVTANDISTSATIDFLNVANDPLAYQQWHLRNTGQKSYALSEQMAQGLVDAGFYTPVEAAEALAEGEAEELVAGEDMNVAAAYAQGVTGAGVTAVVVDSGLEIRHEDLIDNVLVNRSLNLAVSANDRTDPTSLSNSGDHGTSVAGLIAAKGWNNIGSRGTSPDTGLIGMNYLGGDTIEQTELLIHGFPGSGISTSEEISAFNRSYGITWPAFIAYSALDEAIESYPNLMLRSGKGALNIKSNGNSFRSGGREGSFCKDNGAKDLGLTCYSTAFEPSQAHPYYLSVAAVNANGKHTSYSTAGASTMVSAPAGEYGRWAPAMVTTDQMTCINGYSGFNGGTISAWGGAYGEDFAASQFPFNYPGHPENVSCNYTSTFNGTSSAAPNASGVVSLILSANPELTWRDVRHILASTSTLIDAENEKVKLTLPDGSFFAHDGWVENAAGYNFNNLYGFGRVDAGAAVAKALDYSENLGEQIITEWKGLGSTAGEEALQATIPDNSAIGVTRKIEVTEDIIIEAMQFEFDIRNDDMGSFVNDNLLSSAGNDLALEVVSPSGTRSVLLSSKQALLEASWSSANGYSEGYILDGAVFLSNAFYGENARGTWTIKALDTGDTNFEFSDTEDLVILVNEETEEKPTGMINNPVESVLEGVSLRTFGRAAQ